MRITAPASGRACPKVGAFAYADAREFFEAVRDAARDADRISRRLAAMEASEGVRAQGYEPSVSHSRADVNGTARTVARMDYERRVSKRREADYALIDKACSVIYGDEQTGLGGIDYALEAHEQGVTHEV